MRPPARRRGGRSMRSVLRAPGGCWPRRWKPRSTRTWRPWLLRPMSGGIASWSATALDPAAVGPQVPEGDGPDGREPEHDCGVSVSFRIGYDHRAASDDPLGVYDVLQVGENVAVVVDLVVVSPQVGGHLQPPRLRRRQEVTVLLDRPVEHLQGDASLDVDRDDPRHCGLGILAADDVVPDRGGTRSDVAPGASAPRKKR